MINQSTFLLPVRLPSSVMMARTNRAVIGVIGTRSRLVSSQLGTAVHRFVWTSVGFG